LRTSQRSLRKRNASGTARDDSNDRCTRARFEKNTLAEEAAKIKKNIRARDHPNRAFT
jgi:hypothetical protein